MSKAFASQADLQDKKITFEQLSPHCWAYTAEGDPNSGVIIGEKFIMVSDATATPAMAQDLIARIRQVSDKPIKYVLLTHYHAVRVLGASAYVAEGATEIIASRGTYELIVERGAEDMQSEMERFPRLFRGADTVPGLTWPTMVIGDGTAGRQGSLTVDLGGVKVEIWHPGQGHTRGDTIAWVESEKVLFSGDLVEYEAGVYTGDAQLEEWPATLEALRALKAEYIVPGRGEAMKGNADVNKALDYTKRWVTTLFQAGKEAVAANMDLKAAMAHARKSMDPVFGHVFIYEHCLPFDVSRAYDEAKGIKNPRIWTAERDKEMWAALQA
ncbi:MAG: MBL fold metallo-hydrolase [Hydrogenophaga sp.]|jgi:glyoxylase-like metal-dependent hydrolase (beta-lactamase superfamily II)|uniref:MBL fold metallo-hydrolase n=1 Tax=Hydrogenophaga intermedia TaxID=65786 RepID=UPI002043988C|nr:MBL fold metallo-hydrolase [Hydrogenophaga intermedia]MCM3564716.1 MBL fold metallo-hydrolase [Hydrogenophaga intermedia]